MKPRLTQVYPRTLLGRMFLVIVTALCAAQVLNLVAIQTKQRVAYDNRMIDGAIEQFTHQALAILADPAAPLPARGGRPLSRNDVVWLADESIIEAFALPRSNSLEAKARQALNLTDFLPNTLTAAYVSEALWDRVAPGQPVPSETRNASSRRNVHAPSETFLALKLPGQDIWLNGRLRSSPRPPRLLLQDFLVSAMILTLVLGGTTVIISKDIGSSLKALTDAAETVGTTATDDRDLTKHAAEVTEVFEAFNRMEHRISDLLVEKDIMLGAIGHDLRTPLTSLRLRIEEMQPEEMRDSAIVAIDQIVQLLNDILRLAQSHVSDEISNCYDLSSVVSDIVEDYRELGHDVTFFNEERVVAKCKSSSIHQMLRNLLDNAVMYAGHASVTLSKKHGNVEILVEDRGPGLPPESIEAVMRPFQRGDHSGGSSNSGTGLGLTIAQIVARAHQGQVNITNVEPH